jgi:hypothetical protein
LARFRQEASRSPRGHSSASEALASGENVWKILSVFIATLATSTSGISYATVHAVTLGLLTAPTSTSKNSGIRPKKAQLKIFFLASFATGPKMFPLLQCARIAEQHWVSTEAIT